MQFKQVELIAIENNIFDTKCMKLFLILLEQNF